MNCLKTKINSAAPHSIYDTILSIQYSIIFILKNNLIMELDQNLINRVITVNFIVVFHNALLENNDRLTEVYRSTGTQILKVYQAS